MLSTYIVPLSKVNSSLSKNPVPWELIVNQPKTVRKRGKGRTYRLAECLAERIFETPCVAGEE